VICVCAFGITLKFQMTYPLNEPKIQITILRRLSYLKLHSMTFELGTLLAIYFVALTIAAVYLLYHNPARSLYTLLEAWNYIQEAVRRRQNEKLRIAATTHQADTPEQCFYGVVPGLVPADACPWSFVQQFDRAIAQSQEQILQELVNTLKHTMVYHLVR
jgi:hypothetical protein